MAFVAMDSDAELFRAWRDGNATAGDVLVRRHYPGVLRFFEYRTGQAAEDLVQRTFAACAESLARYRGDGTFSGYLFGIARKQLLNFHRSRRSTDDLSRLDAPEQPRAHTWLSTIVARRDEQRLLLQALVALPEPLQTPLVLFYWEGLRARELAVVLGIPTSTATTRLARAREVLREQIDELAGSTGVRDRVLADVDTWLSSLVSRASD
jgi:RNA polymerase sigma-70 factor (ECF subfamily)